MADLLFSERPDVADSSSPSIIRTFVRWVGEARARRAQRAALASLLDLDESRLKDLGVSRDDVMTALQNPSGRAGDALAARRAKTSRDWLLSP